MTLVWVPLIWLMVKIVMRIIPDGRKEQYSLSEPLYLDEKLLGQPTAALQLVAKEVLHCSEIVRDMIRQTRDCLLYTSTEIQQWLRCYIVRWQQLVCIFLYATGKHF